MAYSTLSYTPPYQQGHSGSEVAASGGGGYPVVGARNALDMRRMMQSGHTPDSEYPDGLLGTYGDRHQDKLLQSYGAGGRYDRPYDRGVHKGERLDRDAYSWPAWMTPMSGLDRQANGQKRWAPVGRPADSPSFPGSNTPNSQPFKVEDLARFAPSWK